MRITYKNYPLSKKLTKKSQLVATWTQPLIALCIGAMPGLACMMLITDFDKVPMAIPGALVVAGMVAGLVLAPRIRKKKYAKYDAEYAKIQQAAQNQQAAK